MLNYLTCLKILYFEFRLKMKHRIFLSNTASDFNSVYVSTPYIVTATYIYTAPRKHNLIKTAAVM